MGRRSSDTEEENRSRRKKKHRRRSSSSSSSDSRTYSRKKSGRKSRSRSRSRDVQSRSHSYEKRRRHRSSSSSSYGSRRKRSRSRSRGRGKSYRSQRSRSKSRTRRSRSRPRQRSYSRSSERSSHRRTHSGSRERERRKGREKDKVKEKGKGKEKETCSTKLGDAGNIKAGLEHLTPAEQAKARLQLVLEAAAKADEALKAKERSEEEAKKRKEEGCPKGAAQHTLRASEAAQLGAPGRGWSSCRCSSSSVLTQCSFSAFLRWQLALSDVLSTHGAQTRVNSAPFCSDKVPGNGGHILFVTELLLCTGSGKVLRSDRVSGSWSPCCTWQKGK
uniref:Arginine and serine rich coiled-coil 1 n=1 Tax=Gallus gallus TaxID=9031 RepID=A0A8V0X1K6_CHICK